MSASESTQASLTVVEGEAVTLPGGEFVANAAFLREGTDLILSTPDGQSITVEGYFLHNPAPDLVTPDGAHLSHTMVDAFLPPQHVGQYAEGGAVMNDASPAGQIAEMYGDVTIVRADGTRMPAEVGTPVYPGDVVETSATGAASIDFADNTSFAISESARLSVDEFIYNAAEQSGSTFFSMLQGAFVYTSGLIGKNDPASVNIDTPVGSIGIRGTVVAGHIAPAGQDSTITLVDGAIVLTNEAGTLEMSGHFSTATLNSYQTAPNDAGTMSHTDFASNYNSLSSVAGGAFDMAASFDAPADTGGGSDTGTTGGDAAGADTAPSGEGEAPPPPAEEAATEDAAPANQDQGTAPTQDGTPTAPAPVHHTAPDGTVAPPPPDSGSTFGGLPGANSGTHFSGPTNTNDGAGTGTGGTGHHHPPPPPPGTNNPPSTDTTGNGTPNLQFQFMPIYLNGTATTADDGLNLDLIEMTPFSPVVIGRAVGTHLPSDAVFSITAGPGMTQQAGAPGYVNILGNSYRYDGTGDGNPHDVVVTANQQLFTFNTVTGNLILNDPMAALSFLNGGYNFQITATSSQGGQVYAQHNFVVLHDPQSILPPPTGDIMIGDAGGGTDPSAATAAVNDFLNGTAAGDLITGRGGDDTINGNGGADMLHGGAGNDRIVVYDQSFNFVEGGSGTDTLVLGSPAAGNQNFDFTAISQQAVRDIEVLELGRNAGATGNSVTLTIADVFDMTVSGSGGSHTLTITGSQIPTTSGSTVTIADAAGTGFRAAGGALNYTMSGADYILQGSYNGANVTLIIDNTTSPANNVTLIP